MNNIGIHAYLYRYFSTPNDQNMLQEITKSEDFQVLIGGRHPLADFKTAIHKSLHQSERGKHLFMF